MPARKRGRSGDGCTGMRPRRSRRLMPESYLHLILLVPSPEPDYVMQLRAKRDGTPPPPPTRLQAAQRRLAWMTITLQGNDAAADLAHDLVMKLSREIVGYDHHAQHAKMQEFSGSGVFDEVHGLHSTFRPLKDMWDGSACYHDPLYHVGWFSWGMKTLAAGFLFEGDETIVTSPYSELPVRGVCNGVYTVVGERKGSPLLHCSTTRVYCCRLGAADFPGEPDEWRWVFTFDDPRLYTKVDALAMEVADDEGNTILIQCCHNSRSNAWPVGQHEWTFVQWDVIDDDGDPIIPEPTEPVLTWTQCTMTILTVDDVKRHAERTEKAQKLAARQSVDKIRAIVVSGFASQRGTSRQSEDGWPFGRTLSSSHPLSAVRQDGCYVRQQDIDDGCPHFQNEWGHHLYFTYVDGCEDKNIHVGACFWVFETNCQFLERAVRDWPEGLWQYELRFGSPRGTAAQNLGSDVPRQTEAVHEQKWFSDKDLDWCDLAHDVHLKAFSQEEVSLQLMFLTEERAADAAVVASRKRVDEARSRVKKQLEGMDVLVSGCTIEECNGRFQWVDDQAISGYPRFENEHGLCLCRNEFNDEWKIVSGYSRLHEEPMPDGLGLGGTRMAGEGEDPNDMGRDDRVTLDRSGLLTTNVFHPALLHPSAPDVLSSLLPVGRHPWLDTRQIWEMMRSLPLESCFSEFEACRDRTHQHITIKLRRSRSLAKVGILRG